RTESIGRGLAAAILLGSFGGQGGRSGFSAKDLKLACSKHGLNWIYTDGALLELEERCFYLHTTTAGSLGKRYWFGTKPTLNKLVIQYRQQLSKETFEEEVLEDLRTEAQGGKIPATPTWRVIVNPAEDLPEQKSLTLLIMPPSLAWDDNGEAKHTIQERIKAISTRCGGKDRLYRNTLLFLVGTARGLSKLRQAYRERAALERVRTDYWDQLDEDQRAELTKRLETARKNALEALGSAYTVVLRVHGQEVEACVLADARRTFHEHLGYVWTTLVEDEEWILRRVGSVTLESTGLIPQSGGLHLKDAVEAFLRFTDKPMIAAKEAVTAGLAQACADGLVGIGRGASLNSLQSRHCKQPVTLDPNEDGVWIIPPFALEPTKPPASAAMPTAGVDGGDARLDTRAAATVADGSETPAASKPAAKGSIRRVTIRGKVAVENWSDLFRCFVGPAARMNLEQLRLGVQFEMILPEEQGVDEHDSTLKAMKEAARQLGLEFEAQG
ncbi:hypothetical protein, partial [Roseiflexus sp.]|uniref:hypothetical protein n=1 Tax=Roseiflexus sp. TaxID=2562120 RepID=UPI00398B05B6